MPKLNRSLRLVIYDGLILLLTNIFINVLFRSTADFFSTNALLHIIGSCACVLLARWIGRVYNQVWRYGGIQCYIRLICTDTVALAIITIFGLIVEVVSSVNYVLHIHVLAVFSINLLVSMTMRMMYRYLYKYYSAEKYNTVVKLLMKVFGGNTIHDKEDPEKTVNKIKIAIVGAGSLGVMLAEELMVNPSASYVPVCFVDSDVNKAGKEIHGLKVILESGVDSDENLETLNERGVQEIVFAIANLPEENKKQLYEKYKRAGYKIKVYDYPVMHSAGKKRYLREFDIEELLFRKPIVITDERTFAYYKDKVILITGGGGSIGSELCRQLAKMSPKQIIILDVYENGAYDIQQELKIMYGSKLDLHVEICSITNKIGLARVFEEYHPQIVINAAAHKHVPLMEKNSIEAIENNVFGTMNIVELCEEYGTQRFMMVSTDKAVNPTNVMGATKRMCEMIVQSASTYGKVKYSATRFGNVLGSAGSVIPLFKKQIANGGPITLTDKRIIRYFMTIPEASQLVLQSGAMANNGELFVLDMGQPVKILELAENMIRMSGVEGIEIIETGLRPGEKLYEELLVKTEELDKTENSLIFIERDKPLPKEDISTRLELLQAACRTGDDDLARSALKKAVPTYKAPDEVNTAAEKVLMRA